MITNIKNFPNYTISHKGVVLNKNGIALKFFYRKGQSPYPRVALYQNSKRKVFSIHRLVALYFVPNPNNYPIVHHKDNDPSNPHYKNLEWVTNSMNIKQAYDDGLINKKGTGAQYGTHPKATSLKIIHKQTGEVKAFDSVRRLREHFKIKADSRIYQAIKEPKRTVKGYYILVCLTP